MHRLNYSGRFKHYLRLPLYMIIIFLIENIILYFYHGRVARLFSLCLVVYIVAIVIIYRLNQKTLDEKILNFVTSYGLVQKEVLDSLDVPYALFTKELRMLWANEAFTNLTGKPKTYEKSLTSIIPELTRELLESHEQETFSIPIEYEEMFYRCVIRRVDVKEKHPDADSYFAGDEMISLVMFDESELTDVKKKLQDEQMVCALVYIDNYEENVDAVEAVKKSMLRAIIERKVNKYFQKADAIVRRIERDKFIVFFERKYLSVFEDDTFSILEDIKTTKVGNVNEITLSIGIGFGTDSYTQSADFARTAIELALGRGGSQAVLKNGEEISYYGVRGKEIEKNTRVKARVKAQALRELMNTRDNVIIMGHSMSDIDCLGAAVGVYCAAREVGKKAQIILNTVTTSLRPLMDSFTEENGYERDMFIDNVTALTTVTERTLVVVVDTNRPSYTECPQLLKRSDSVVVFDHHRQGQEQIDNPLLSYIEPYASSASEMVAECLQYFSEKVHIKACEADTIYAGILIDTNNFMAKTGVRTFEAAAYLKRNGAEVVRVRKLLREDMDTYKARAEIVRDAEVYKGTFAISVCKTKDIESPTIVAAQAANELLNIVGIKASVVLTEYNNKIYVSSRSIDEIDVQKMMEELGGGGHMNVAGAQISDSSVEKVIAKIKSMIDRLE